MTDTINVNELGPFTDAPNQANPATGDAFLIDRGGVLQHVFEEDLKTAIVGTPASTDGSFQERIEGTTDGIATTFSFVDTTPASADYVDIFIDGRLRRDFTLDGQDVVFDSPPIGGETYVLIHWQTVGGSGGGVTDHGALTGLADDDHGTGANAYHTDARAAAWLESNHEATHHPDATQTIFIAAAGNDSSDGLSPDQAKLTIGGAITAASALTPASDNYIVIRGDDAAEYTEDITVPRYVWIDMPNAHLIGGVTSTNPDAGVRFRQITKSTSGSAVLLNSATAGQFWVDVEKIIINDAANGIACSQAAALMANVPTLVNNGTNHGIVGLTTAPGHIHFEGEDIYLAGTGFAVGLAVGGTIHVHAKHILNTGAGAGTAINADDGTIFVNCNDINVTQAWDIEAGATVYLDCDSVTESGSSANAGTLYDWKAVLSSALQPSDVGTAAAEDVGTAVDDVVQLVDVGGGTPGLPAVDGSQLTGLPGGGDMLAATYDPQAISADAFDADNHTDGTTNKVYTDAEKTKLGTIGTILEPTVAIDATYPTGETEVSKTFSGVAVGDAVLDVLPPAGEVTEQIYCYGGKVTGADTISFIVNVKNPAGLSGLTGNFTAVVMDRT